MKKTLLTLSLLVAMAAMPSAARAEDDEKQPWSVLCDVDRDGSVNAADIATVVGFMLGDITDDDDPPVEEPTYDLNGFEAVDLGLSVLWSPFNIGATFLGDYGMFIQWGELYEEHDNDDNPYNGPYNAPSWAYWNLAPETLVADGVIDENYILTPAHDAACVHMGGDWRLPTKEEFLELINNCTLEVDVLEKDHAGNDVLGSRYTGPNGNSIFFPYGGFIGYQTHSSKDIACNLWLANYDSKNNTCRGILSHISYACKVVAEWGINGQNMRGVITKK